MTQKDPHAGTLAFLEAAYAWELADEPWLRGLMAATAKLWGRPRWMSAYQYDVSVAGRFALGPLQFRGVTPSIQRLLVERIIEKGPEMAPIYRTMNLGFGRPLGGVNEAGAHALARADTADYFGLNGLDGNGTGCFIGIGAERTQLDAREMVLYHRLACHLGSAYRCRQRLRAARVNPQDDSEAVLGENGRLLEARGPATRPTARLALREATRDLQRLRDGRTHDGATDRWRPRLVGRWTLLTSYTRQGERYILARENQTRMAGLEALTEREQQVVASAVTGKSNKEIAYDLGVSHSTARVLLSRAFARLNVHSREELLALPAIRGMRGEPP